MDESEIWSPVSFGDDGSMECPNVGDHFVYALAVHLEKPLLILHTEYRDGPGPGILTELLFFGHVAHSFDNVAGPSILFDIDEVAAGWLVEEWGE